MFQPLPCGLQLHFWMMKKSCNQQFLRGPCSCDATKWCIYQLRKPVTPARLQCKSHRYDQLLYQTVDQTSESVLFWLRPLAAKVMPILMRL